MPAGEWTIEASKSTVILCTKCGGLSPEGSTQGMVGSGNQQRNARILQPCYQHVWIYFTWNTVHGHCNLKCEIWNIHKCCQELSPSIPHARYKPFSLFFSHHDQSQSYTYNDFPNKSLDILDETYFLVDLTSMDTMHAEGYNHSSKVEHRTMTSIQGLRFKIFDKEYEKHQTKYSWSVYYGL